MGRAQNGGLATFHSCPPQKNAILFLRLKKTNNTFGLEESETGGWLTPKAAGLGGFQVESTKRFNLGRKDGWGSPQPAEQVVQGKYAEVPVTPWAGQRNRLYSDPSAERRCFAFSVFVFLVLVFQNSSQVFISRP